MTVSAGGASAEAKAGSFELVRYLEPDELDDQLRRDARSGLTGAQKSIPSKWFYDERGSRLFDEITRLPEYYLTRAEREILRERSGAIAERTGAETLVELGSGTSEKTRILLDACCGSGHLRRFVPFDVDAGTLQFAATELVGCYGTIEVCGVIGDFERHLDAVAQPGRAVVAFLGSTIGNLDRRQRAAFLEQLCSALKPGDFFLVGVDLVKDPAVLWAAYNDAQGVTAEFNLNILRVLNRRLAGDFNLASFDHLADFNPIEERIELWLRSATDQRVRLGAIDLDVDFGAGELLHTEISCKFRRQPFEQELRGAGLEPAAWWTDPGDRFALSLSQKP